jgi:hypothetical protein
MAWEAQEVREWGVCWKWGVPYPCKKTKTKYCCTGFYKWRVWGVGLRENYFCCDGNESHWWSGALFVGLPMWHLVRNARVCRGSIPSETKGCVNFTGDFPEFPADVPEEPEP